MKSSRFSSGSPPAWWRGAHGIALAVASLLAACNQLFGIDEPTLGDEDAAGTSGSSAGTSGQGSGGGSSAGETAAGRGGSAGRGGAASGGKGGANTGGTSGTGGDASGGSSNASSSGGSNVAGGSGTGGGSPGTGGSAATGGSSGADDGGAGTGSGDAGDGGTGGTGGTVPVDPCAAPDLRGGELVLVPGGTGVIGSENIENENALPVHGAEFEDFCIDRFEVTQNEYSECAAGGGCAEPNTTEWGSACHWLEQGYGEHPVVCIDWPRANAYCLWANKRLPTEKEWEYAARGTLGRPYPWGDPEPTNDRLNWNLSVNDTTIVGSYAGGATPGTDIRDLAGNVWEWTASIWCETYDAGAACDSSIYVARGGSFASTLPIHVSPAWRDPVSAGDDRFGFRCALGAGEVR